MGLLWARLGGVFHAPPVYILCLYVFPFFIVVRATLTKCDPMVVPFVYAGLDRLWLTGIAFHPSEQARAEYAAIAAAFWWFIASSFFSWSTTTRHPEWELGGCSLLAGVGADMNKKNPARVTLLE